MKGKNAAMYAAMKDITKYLEEMEVVVSEHHFKDVDVWVVTPNRLRTRKNRLLNNQLGL